MREIKVIGHRIQSGRNYLFSLFECDVCGNRVERIRRDGLKAMFCSHPCYAVNRKCRGPYKHDGVMISGYKYIQAPYHPQCSKKGYVSEHRLVAENTIGRYLMPNEVVHHINEIKTDNRPENLMVMTNADHIRLHKTKCKRTKYGQFTI